MAYAREPRYPFVHVDVAPEDVDETSAALFELGAEGVEERDATTLAKSAAEGKVTLVASFATLEDAEHAIAELGPALAPRYEEIVGDAWRDAWKEHFRPFAIAPNVVVRPPWETYDAKPGEAVLELEPGRAFGTGLHETTRLVARALASPLAGGRVQGAHVLDVGTGSGVLALVALALGAARATAIDVDPEAIDVARENADRNGLAGRLEASVTPLEEVRDAFPVVLANIEARVLVPMAPALLTRVAAEGLLLLSGVLTTQRDAVVAAYPDARLVAAPELGEWVLLALEKPA